MKVLVTIALAAGVVAAGVHAQAPVQIIELPAVDRSRIAFRLDAEPSLTMGKERVPGGYFWAPNRVARFSDGRIALATLWGFSRLHVVDPAGKASAIGNFSERRGSLEAVCRTTDDRLLTFHDFTTFTLFGLSGAVESSGARPRGSGTMLCPPNGQQVWVRIQLPGATPGPPTAQPHDPSVTASRFKAALRLLDLGDGARVVADLGEFDTLDFYPVGPIPDTIGRNRVSYGWRLRPFARDLATAVDGARIHAGDGTTWEVRTWDSTGRLARILRVGSPPDRVTPELRAAFIEERFSGNTPAYRDGTIVQDRYRDVSIYPPELPAYSELRVDRGRRLWVRRYPRPLDQTQEWWVFTAEAQYIGRVDVPAAFGIEEIGDDYIAGSYLLRKAVPPESDAIMDRSDYDVRVYRLRRG